MSQAAPKTGPFFPENLKKRFEDKEFRSAYVADFVRSGVAYQVRDMREAREWSQKCLASKAETTQSVISRSENPEYGRFNVSTLLDLARAFDVALVIKFVPFRELFEIASDFSKSAMNVASFSTADLEGLAATAKPMPILLNEEIGRTRGQSRSLSEMMKELSDEHRQLRDWPLGLVQDMGRSPASLWMATQGDPRQHLGEIQLRERIRH